MESITRRQTLLIGISLVLDAALVSLPNQIIGIARMDAWLSYLVAALPVLAALWLLIRASERMQGRDLFETIITRSPVAGRLLSLPIILFFFVILVRDIRALTEYVTIVLLPNTPLMMLTLLIIISVVLTGRLGLYVIARMTELWLPLMLLILVLIPVLLFPEFDMTYLRPLFYDGFVPPMEGGWYAVAYIGELILLPFLIPSGTLRLREGLLSLGIGTGLLLMIHFLLILSMGAPMAGKMLFPLYETVRLIRVTDFLDRFDLPLLVVYLPVMIVKIALMFYTVMHGLKRVVPQLGMKKLIVPFGAWVFVCSFWFFENSVQLLNLNRTWPVYALFCIVVVPALIYGLMFFRGRKGSPAPSRA